MSTPRTRVIEGCAIATCDPSGREFSDGHLVIEDGRIASIGEGPAYLEDDRAIDRIAGDGLLATPGLVNCHHHLYQWLTRGLATEATLFEWLESLYPTWALIEDEMEGAAAAAGIAALLLSGCSTTTDHHYVFPAGAGDLFAAEIESARTLGVRFHPTRGSMDLGRSEGGLPPDEVTEDRDAILASTEEAVDRYHDRSFDSMLRIGIAPCSPFSVTGELMRESASLARRKGVRLHTHLAETREEEEFCREQFGVRPVEYLERLDWLGDDVWLAHCVHLDDGEVARLGAAGTGVAHCPTSNARLGAGMAPVRSLLDVGAPVGLGVDGAASNEAGELGPEMRSALLTARLRSGDPAALTAREALRMATIEGARCLGRSDEIGSLEAGKVADVALWRMDDLWRTGIEDPVAALVLGAPRPVEHLLVGGTSVVSDGHLSTGDEERLVRDLDRAVRRLRERAGGIS